MALVVGPVLGLALALSVVVAAAAPLDPPTCADVGRQSAHHGTTTAQATLSCTAQDPDATTVGYAITRYPDHGSVSLDPSGAFTWDAPVEFAGDDSFGYVATDDLSNATTEQTVALRSTNSAPTCSPVALGDVLHGGPATTGAANCADADPQDTLTYSQTAPDPAKGTASVGTAGSLDYTAFADQIGADSFGYSAGDGAQTASSTVSVTITNTAPTCNDVDLGSILHGAGASGFADCTDPDSGDSLTFEKTGAGPSHGTATVDSTGAIGYTPAAGYSGSDTFHYRAADQLGAQSATKAVTVVVSNDAPTCAAAVDVTTHWNTAVAIGHACSDPDGADNPVTVTVTSPPAHGTLSAFDTATRQWTYTPNDKYLGADQFSYTATDGISTTPAVVQKITVTNAAPICQAPHDVTTHWNTPVSIFESCFDMDREDGPVKITVGTPPAHGTLSTFNTTTRSWTYTPNDKYVGADSFTYTASDGVATGATVTQHISVTNQVPTCSDMSETIRLGKPAKLFLSCFDFDLFDPRNPDRAVITLVGTPVNGAVSDLKYDPIAGAVATFTPTATGPASFKFKLGDGVAESAVATATIGVTVNHAPDCSFASTTAVAPGGTFDVFPGSTCYDQDYQDDTLTFAITQQPAKGTLSALTNGTATYTAGTASPERDQFTVDASDGTLHGSLVQRVHIATTPLCTPAPTVRVRPGRTKTTSMDCTNAPGSFSAMTFTLDQGPTKGQLLNFNQGQFGSFVTYRADSAALGADSYRLKVSNGSTSSLATQDIEVTPDANEPPTCFDSSLPGQRVFNDRANVLSLSSWCFDADQDPLTFRKAAGAPDPQHGTLITSGNGLAYTPAAAYLGHDEFSLAATDDHGATSDPITYNLNVTAPEKPACSTPPAISVRPGRAKSFFLFCSSPQSDPQTYGVHTDGAKGTVSLSGGANSSQFTYAAGAVEGTDSFKIRAINQIAASDPVTVPVTITATANDAPFCSTNSSFSPQAVSKTGDTVLALAARCTDADGDPLQFKRESPPTHGTIDAGPSGTLSYHADGVYLGPDQFTFRATDDHNGTSSLVTYYVNVVPSISPTCTQRPTLNVRPGATKRIDFSCTDPNNGQITYKIVSAPTIGILQPSGDSTSPARFFTAQGTATDGTFTYKATSQTGGDSQVYTQNIHIAADANDVPTCISNVGFPQSVATARQTTLSTSTLCSDPDGDPMTYEASQVQSIATAHGTVVNEAGVIKYTSNAGYTGADAVAYVAKDDHQGTSVPGSFKLAVVTPAVPTCSTPQAISMRPGQQRTAFTSCSDATGETLTYKIGTAPTKGTLNPAGDSPQSTRTYTAGNAEGTDSFTFYATSINGTASAVTQQITISTTSNQAPSCFSNSFSPKNVQTGQATVLAPSCSDLDADPMTFQKVSSPLHGTVTDTNGVLTYTSEAAYTGPDSFTYKALDDHGGQSGVTTFYVNVIQPTGPTCNTLPVIPVRPGQSRSGSLSCTDQLNAPITYVIDTQPAHGTLSPSTNSTQAFRTYTADSGYSGPDSFTYHGVSTSGTGAPVTQQFDISSTANVNPGCQSNAGSPKGVESGVDTELAPSCSDLDGDPLTYQKVTDPAHGAVTVVGGKLHYTSTAGYLGPDSFTYRALDDHTGQSAVTTFSINVIEPTGPTCNPGAALQVRPGQTKPVVLNCTDPLGGAVTYVIDTQPAKGTLTPSGTSTTAIRSYQAGSVQGQDSIVYHGTSGNRTGQQVTQAINITTTANVSPACPAGQTLTAVSGVATEFTPSCSDSDADQLTYAKTTSPAHGTLTGPVNGKFTYTSSTSAVAYTGPDSFGYSADDGHGGITNVTVSVTVTPKANQGPTCTPPGTQNVVAGELKSISATCEDPDADTISVVPGTAPAHGTLGTPTVTGGTVAFDYTPNATYSGTDSFTFRVSDGNLQSPPYTVNVSVNRRPTCPVVADVAVVNHTAKQLQVACTDADNGPSPLTFTKVANPAHGTLGSVSTTGQVTYTPTGDYTGPDSFQIKASDGRDESAVRTVNLNVAPNADPACQPIAAMTTKHDTARPATATCTDAEGDTVALSQQTAPAHGTLAFSALQVTYTPAANYVGADQFTVRATDGHGGTLTLPQTGVTVTNAKPACQAATAAVDAHKAKAVPIVCTDADNDALTVSKATEPGHGTATLAGTTATYAPTGDYAGPDAFTVKASDGIVDSDPATVSLTVAANALPACQPLGALTTRHDTAKSVTATCTDADGDTVTLSQQTGPAHGTLAFQGLQVTYTPAAGYVGSDQFTVRAADGHGGSSTLAQTDVSVTNAAPACEAKSADVAHNTAKAITLGCTDADGDPVTIVKASDPAHGTVAIAGTTATYTPASGFGGSDSFTYKATDGRGGESAPATVSLKVASAPVVDPPKPPDTPKPPVEPDTSDARMTALAARLVAQIAKVAGKLDAKKPALDLGAVTAADCPKGCTVTIAVLQAAKKLGSATITIPAGGTGKAKVTLNAAAKKLLKKGKAVKATVKITVRDAASGVTKSLSKPASLKAKKKK
jgi:hypothetical protein